MKGARWLLAALLLAWATGARAAPSQEQLKAARALADAGFELFSEGSYQQALERFQGAEAIFHATPHVLFMARCERELGKLTAARAHFQAVADETPPPKAPPEFKEAQQEAKSELAALVALIPSVKISVTGPAPEKVLIALDGEDVSEAARRGPLDADPGARTIRVSAEGWEPTETTVELAAKAGVVDVQLSLEKIAVPVTPPAASPAPPPKPVVVAEEEPGSIVPGLVGFGVGAAGLAVGIITGVMAMDRADELATACPIRTQCASENEELEEGARTLGTVSTVGFVAGGVGLAAGVVLIILRPGGGPSEPDEPTEAQAHVRPMFSPLGMGVAGTF